MNKSTSRTNANAPAPVYETGRAISDRVMSGNLNCGNVTKKTAHVKWAGRSIALGTFPVAEAKRKAEEAKKLTKLWRATKKPRPSRDWVIDELERLSVRVISVRRRSTTEEMDGEKSQTGKKSGSTAGVYAKQHTVAEKGIRRVSYADSDISGDEEGDDPSAKRARTQDAIDVCDVATSITRRSSLNLIASILNDTDFDQEISIPGVDVLFGEVPTCRGGSSANNSRTDTAASVIARTETSRPTMSHYKMLQIHHANLVEELKTTKALLDMYQQHIPSWEILRDVSNTEVHDVDELAHTS